MLLPRRAGLLGLRNVGACLHRLWGDNMGPLREYLSPCHWLCQGFKGYHHARMGLNGRLGIGYLGGYIIWDVSLVLYCGRVHRRWLPDRSRISPPPSSINRLSPNISSFFDTKGAN